MKESICEADILRLYVLSALSSFFLEKILLIDQLCYFLHIVSLYRSQLLKFLGSVRFFFFKINYYSARMH